MTAVVDCSALLEISDVQCTASDALWVRIDCMRLRERNEQQSGDVTQQNEHLEQKECVGV